MVAPESSSGVHFEGMVSVKRTFLWAERKLVVFDDRIELSQVEKAHSNKIVILIQNLSLAPIIQHHTAFEFTVFASQRGYMQRVRIRTPRLVDTEHIYDVIEKIKDVYVGQQRSINADIKRTRSSKIMELSAVGECVDQPVLIELDNPRMSVNVILAVLVLLAAWLAPLLNSWLLTISVIVVVGTSFAAVLSFLGIAPPSIQIMLVFTPPIAPPSMQRSKSYLYSKDFKVRSLDEVESVHSHSARSSIHEDGYATPAPGSPDRAGVRVLFSESSKYLSSLAADLDYRTCYSFMLSISETVLLLLHSQPVGIGPPGGLVFVSKADRISVVADDLDCTRSEWNVIRNKGGMMVLTSKLATGMTRWPVICSRGTIKASVDSVYTSVSNSEIFRSVDEFGGDYRIVDYIELTASASGEEDDQVFENSSLRSGSDSTMLVPETCPFLIKYQEMKSVWPVQARDYLVGQCGFAVEAGRLRGKFLISKSVDPNPKDPFGDCHEGFVRGSLTASCFLILENAENPKHSDVWTFLHCDMKGSLSGNGKIADFITQSQMPKFFQKLESVSISLESI